MRNPIFIRALTEDEHHQVQKGLHSSDAFVLRRCQILLASSRGERAPAIGRQLGCDDQTVRNVIKGFNATGLAVLHEGSSRPHHLRTTFTEQGCQRLQDLLHRSPRDFGQDRGVWTLELAAQVSGLRKGLSPPRSPTNACVELSNDSKRTGSAPSTGLPAPIRNTYKKKRTRPIDRLGQSAV